jgi:AraC-like DNA-binding protein
VLAAQPERVLLLQAKYLTIRASFGRARSSFVSRRIVEIETGIDKFVAGSNPRRRTAAPSTAGIMTRQACARVAAAGIDPAPLLAKAGLTVEQIADRNTRFDAQSQITFLELAAEALRDDFLGFHLARDHDLRETGLLYYVLASSDLLDDAVRRAERYSSLNNEGISLTVRDEGATAVTFHYVDIERHSDRHQMEYLLTAVVRICRQLTSRHLVPRYVSVSHRRADGAPELNAFLGCDVAFGGDADEIVSAESFKDIPVVSGDPYLNELLVKYCEDALAQRPATRTTLRKALEDAIAPLLPHGKAHVDDVARQLGMSRRTLARRLKSEGLTFAGVLADLRIELARRQLRAGDLPISEIAWLLGYREVSAFTHACKRWTGKTPRELRIGG